MALIVNFTTKEGRDIGVRIGTDDQAFARATIERIHAGCKITSMKTEEAPTDGNAVVSRFAESAAWKTAQDAKEKAEKESPKPKIVSP